MAELIKELSSTQKLLSDVQGKRDFYLRLIAQNANIFGVGGVPYILDDTARRTILAFVREVSGNSRNSIVPIANGKGASNGN